MNIVRLYNQNRKQLFIVVIIVASIILAIHFVNYLVKQEKDQNLNMETSSSSTNSTTTTYKPQESAISKSSVSNASYKIHSEVIDNFIEYCNAGNIEEAYDLLSKDCKDVLFPTLEYFRNNYYNQIFTENKLYTIKNWTGRTYKVKITSNMLETGKANNGAGIEDYFTIVNENDKYKLNINGFIKREDVNKSNSNSNVNIDILYKDVYMDYITYMLKAANGTDKTILLDSGENTQNIYIVDDNNVKHMSYINEIPTAELKVLPNSENILKIKFASPNILDRQIVALVFKDIILDYNTYEESILKGNYLNRLSIKVDL